MQPLNLLKTVQKARLLHSLLKEEILNFLGYLNELTETVLNDKERLKADWKDQLFSFDLWLTLAGDVQKVMAKYGIELQKSAPVFADQLFEGYNAIFTIQALTNYVSRDEKIDLKFKAAVELLFS